MSVPSYERVAMPVPFYVRAANTISSELFSMGRPLVSAALGAAWGKFSGKTATYAMQSALSELFWKYIHPNTIQKAFMHPASNGQARVLGVMLSCAASVAIPYAFTKYVTPHIDKNTPILGKLKEEYESNKIGFSDAVKSSLVPILTVWLRTFARNQN